MDNHIDVFVNIYKYFIDYETQYAFRCSCKQMKRASSYCINTLKVHLNDKGDVTNMNNYGLSKYKFPKDAKLLRLYIDNTTSYDITLTKCVLEGLFELTLYNFNNSISIQVYESIGCLSNLRKLCIDTHSINPKDLCLLPKTIVNLKIVTNTSIFTGDLNFKIPLLITSLTLEWYDEIDVLNIEKIFNLSNLKELEIHSHFEITNVKQINKLENLNILKLSGVSASQLIKLEKSFVILGIQHVITPQCTINSRNECDLISKIFKKCKIQQFYYNCNTYPKASTNVLKEGNIVVFNQLQNYKILDEVPLSYSIYAHYSELYVLNYNDLRKKQVMYVDTLRIFSFGDPENYLLAVLDFILFNSGNLRIRILELYKWCITPLVKRFIAEYLKLDIVYLSCTYLNK